MRRVLYLGVALCVAGCGPQAAAVGSSSTAHPTPATAETPGASALANAAEEAVLGPGGMTLRQEIGAVMMVGFKGPITPAILADWRQHQFGGLIIVPINQNATDPMAIRQLIQSVRGVMAHRVLIATNQEGGTVCFKETRVSCMAGARQVGSQSPEVVQTQMTTMSTGLKALGFDINFAPVADVWDGVHSPMSDRCYGQNPETVAQDVTAAIAGIHAAGIYAVAERLSVQPPQTRDWIPLQVAIASHVEFVMLPSSSQLPMLRTVPGYQGVIISDDLQLGPASLEFPPPSAAVRFLANGGDMVIVSHDIAVADATYDAIREAVLSGAYPRVQLDASVQKLLNLGLRFMP
jgi:beta-N-acetylhexosaminidase